MPAGGRALWLHAADGTRLRAIVWSNVEARGSVFVFGGRTEFAEKYFEVVQELIGRGYAVATVDWRGQGLSDRALPDPRKGHVDDFAAFDSDLNAFMDEVAPSMPKPWIGLAHSMGGNVLMRALHDRPGLFSVAVMTAPMLGLRLGSPLVIATLNLVAAAGSRLGLAARYVPGGSSAANDAVPFEQNILTHDRGRYALNQAQISAEPALGLGSATYGWLAAGFRSIRRIMRADYLSAITTPLLIVGASEDRLIERDALDYAASHVRDGTFVLIKGSHHEVLIETDEVRAQFWAAFDDFIASRMPSQVL
jgi:lysophospholipase